MNLRPPDRTVCKIRTYETSLITLLRQFLSYWLTVTKSGTLPTALHPDISNSFAGVARFERTSCNFGGCYATITPHSCIKKLARHPVNFLCSILSTHPTSALPRARLISFKAGFEPARGATPTLLSQQGVLSHSTTLLKHKCKFSL